jgi:hypothetical protein
MRGIALSILLIIWCGGAFAQNGTDWSRYIRTERPQILKQEKSGVFMVETSLDQIYLSGSEVRVLRSFDETHHIVKGDVDNIDKVWLVDNNWKLSLTENIDNSLFHIVTSRHFDRTTLQSFQILKEHTSSNTFLINGKAEDVLDVLLNNDDVIHITNKIPKPKVESRVIDMNLNPNRVNKIHHLFPNLNGSSETVSIQENNYNDSDIDLLNRNVESGLESEVVDNHATEMATIIAGKGNSFVTGRGVANSVSITSSDFIDAMPDSDESYESLGINTQNHSYGIPRENEYGVQARAFDLSAFNNQNLLHIFSSGNEGLEVSSDGNYKDIEGFANLTGNIKMTKNSLVVGSVDTVGNIPAFVSRGPTYDGRVKPEVVAYSVVGSSNSAALVSGLSILLQQQYREIYSTDMPSAFVKALLINGAEDVGPEGLDFLTGYGSVNAWRSLQMLQSDQFLSGTITNGNIESFNLNIPTNAINLKVTLVWTDPAANVSDYPALVNNLDLRLVDGATSILPWVLDASSNAADLSKPATRGVDNLNNVEQVTIENPASSYLIEVEGALVAGSQEFYIAWQYDLADSYEWDFPTGSDNMPYNGETGSYFRWSSTKTGTGELSYSSDDANWTVLSNEIDLSTGYWRWNTPPLINDEVKARMVIGSETFETEPFVVSVPQSASVGFNCGDSLMLKWNPSPNAINYTVYNLGEEELEEYTTVNDTFLIIPNIVTLESRRFSIQPNLSSGKNLIPTPTFDYTLQGVECYVFSLFQQVALDTGIYVNLTLGTTYGIEEIIIERNDFNSFKEIFRISNPQANEISILDDSPGQGFNEHWATVRFINGEELVLSAGTSYYLTEVPYRIYPNPVRADESLYIITKEFEDRTPNLELIDEKGAIVHKQIVQGSRDDISIGGLKSGIYFYRLIADDQVFTGRILVR